MKLNVNSLFPHFIELIIIEESQEESSDSGNGDSGVRGGGWEVLPFRSLLQSKGFQFPSSKFQLFLFLSYSLT